MRDQRKQRRKEKSIRTVLPYKGTDLLKMLPLYGLYHGRIRKEEEAWRTCQETQIRERKLGETNPRMEIWIRKNTRERKEERKVQNKFPKFMWENQDMFICWTYHGRTWGVQPPKHQIFINAQHTEYKALDKFVLISSKRRDNEQGGNWWTRNL